MMRLAASMAGVALALAGCSGAPPDDYLPLNDISDPDAATSVAIELPAEGSTVDSTFEVEVEVNGDLSTPDAVLKPNGLPHLHFRLDGGAFDPDQAQLDPVVEKREDPAAYSPSVKTRLTYEDVPPGEHVLLVDLVRDDHDPAAEIAGSSVTFRVKDE